MKIITLLHKSVLDILKRNEIYRADYSHIFNKDYIRQYRFLAKCAGFLDCPIFCALSEDIIDSSNLSEDKNHVLLHLDVPEDETYCTEYYDWTDYLYYTDEEPDNISMIKELEKYLSHNRPASLCEDPQIIIDRIEPKWVKDLNVNVEDNLDDISDLNTIERILDYLPKWVEKRGLSVDNVPNGPTYILPDGKFIDFSKISGMNIHYHLFMHYVDENNIRYDSDRLLRVVENDLNWLRVNSGTTDDDNRCYISLNKDKLSYDQYDALLKWLDYVRKTSRDVLVFVDNDVHNYVKYSFMIYTSDEIIKKVKRYYSSGKLYEKVEKSDEVKVIDESKVLRLPDDLSDTLLKKYYSNYKKLIVSLLDILRDTDDLHNNSMKTRRTDVWGDEPLMYTYKSDKGYYANISEPIRLAKINDKFIVLDGNHRIRALVNDDYDAIEALVRER